jgi:hypothetical protein
MDFIADELFDGRWMHLRVIRRVELFTSRLSRGLLKGYERAVTVFAQKTSFPWILAHFLWPILTITCG